MYVQEEHLKKIQEYKSTNLEALLKNDDLNSQDRAELIHDAISDQMYNMFEHSEISKTSIATSKEHISVMVSQMVENKIHTQSLLKLISHDYSTYSHSVNVSIYALALAKELNYSESSMIKIGAGALLHDLGKSKTSPAIINKPSKLTLEEYKEMKKHPEAGYNILKDLGETDPLILEIVQSHHEKLDGSGYFRGLSERFIKQEVQLVTVADIFDALTTNRAYKVAASHFTSFKTMKVVMSQQINVDLIDKLITLMGKKE